MLQIYFHLISDKEMDQKKFKYNIKWFFFLI